MAAVRNEVMSACKAGGWQFPSAAALLTSGRRACHPSRAAYSAVHWQVSLRCRGRNIVRETERRPPNGHACIAEEHIMGKIEDAMGRQRSDQGRKAHLKRAAATAVSSEWTGRWESNLHRSASKRLSRKAFSFSRQPPCDRRVSLDFVRATKRSVVSARPSPDFRIPRRSASKLPFL